jgi:pimeloyl-ACP methyl ester carboxylesterase
VSWDLPSLRPCADSRRFFGPLVEREMQRTANNVLISEVFEECGHSLALEQPERLAGLLKKFLS